MKLSPEYILDKHADKACWVIAEDLQENVIIPSMEEYGKQQYNQAIKDAAENATAINDEWFDYGYQEWRYGDPIIDKDSILKLLKP